MLVDEHLLMSVVLFLVVLICNDNCFCDARHSFAHRGGHGSPLFVVAVAAADGVDAVVLVLSCTVFPSG